MSNELMIPFENLEKRGVQTDVPEKLDTSFFATVYEQTFKLIDQIDKANARFAGNDETYKRSQSFNDVQNVIAFTGRRGTGKTSSMLSVLDALTIKDHSIIEDLKHFDFAEKSFCTIPYTDASMLSENDDIFEIVLSKMFSSLQGEFDEATYPIRIKSKYEAQMQGVKSELCEIYNHYSSMKKGTSESSGTSSNVMSRLADKYNVRQEFIELVANYTRLFANNQNKKEGYFVICIDDIDMTQQKHMILMQCIHQYFMIPGVLVLLSTNFQLLTSALQKDYFETVATSKSNIDEHDNQMHLTKKQTYDFLKKIIPPDMRITLPSWMKKDYTELFPIKINFGNNNAKTVLEKFPDLSGSELITQINGSSVDFTLQPKELIMLMLANRTRIFLDITGFKFHFMQPDSLRNLSDLFYMLYNMDNIQLFKDYKHLPDKKYLYFTPLEHNRKIILDYLHFKILEEYNFDSEIRIFLAELLSEPMERRGRKIWDFYYKQLSKKNNKKRIENIYGKKFYRREFKRFKIENYSFGELYRVLCFSTRLGVFNRDFVKFILASFSFSMPQFIEIQKRDKSDLKPDGKEFLRTYNSFKYSLIGTWCNDLFNNRKVSVRIDKEKNFAFLNKIKQNQNFEDSLTTLENYIKSLVYLLCFYSESVKVPIETRCAGESIFLDIKADPTSFIINSLRLKHRISKMVFEIKNDELCKKYNDSRFKYAILKLIDAISGGELYEIAEGFTENNKNIEEWFEQIICNIEDDLTNDDKMPWDLLKHTDLTYNVIKRTMIKLIYESDNNLNPHPISEDDPFKIMQQFYECCFYNLEDEEDNSNFPHSK